MTDWGVIDMQRGFAMQGNYIAGEKRILDARENKASHFSMGNHPRINAS